MSFNESTGDGAGLTWFEEQGYAIAHRLNFSFELLVAFATSTPDRVVEVEP